MSTSVVELRPVYNVRPEDVKLVTQAELDAEVRTRLGNVPERHQEQQREALLWEVRFTRRVVSEDEARAWRAEQLKLEEQRERERKARLSDDERKERALKARQRRAADRATRERLKVTCKVCGKRFDPDPWHQRRAWCTGCVDEIQAFGRAVMAALKVRPLYRRAR